jgi:hypothetical protein
VGALLSGVLVNCSKRLRRAVRERLLSRGSITGPNKEIAPPQLNKAIGADVDSQFGRLWLAAKNVAFWPLPDEALCTANVRYGSESCHNTMPAKMSASTCQSPKAASPLSAHSGRLGAVAEGPTWGRKRPSRRATKRQISTTSAMLPQPVVLPHRASIHRCIY